MGTQYLEALKTQKNLTNKQISELSGVPAATVQRVLAGTGESSFETVVKIISAMGGSLDDMVGNTRDEGEIVRELRAMLDAQGAQINTYEKVIGSYDGIIAEKERAVAYLKKIIRYLAIALTALGMVFVGIVIFDILNGGVGYIRYDELSRPVQEGMNVLLSVLPFQ